MEHALKSLYLNMKDNSILLVEDDESLGFVTRDSLTEAGYNVNWAKDGSSAVDFFQKKSTDLIILDIMLPRIDGFSVAESIRKVDKDVPILFLSAKSMLEDRLEGFSKGGDDYITKPFSMEELLFKIDIFIKRSKTQDKTAEFLSVGNYRYYPAEMRLSHPEGEQSLTRKEGTLLKFLLSNKGRVLKREEILKAVWGEDDYFLGRSLDVFIVKLRKYLSNDANIQITNIHGVGFKLVEE